MYPSGRSLGNSRVPRNSYEVQDELKEKYAIRLVPKARDSKGRGKALDEWHCRPVGRGRVDKQDREGNNYTILGSLPPSNTLCSICWMDGHWKSQCKARDLSYEMWEPVLTVLQSKERKSVSSFPCVTSLSRSTRTTRIPSTAIFLQYACATTEVSQVRSGKRTGSTWNRKDNTRICSRRWSLLWKSSRKYRTPHRRRWPDQNLHRKPSPDRMRRWKLEPRTCRRCRDQQSQRRSNHLATWPRTRTRSRQPGGRKQGG